MDTVILEKIRQEYSDNEDIIQLYEEWGNSPYLKMIFSILDKRHPDWNLERELGSWAAEFILELLQEHEEEFDAQGTSLIFNILETAIEEQYADFKSGRQFVRINNLSLQFDQDESIEYEDLEDYIAEHGKQKGFPIVY